MFWVENVHPLSFALKTYWDYYSKSHLVESEREREREREREKERDREKQRLNY